METISSILKMVRPNVYFTKVDIRDAYYSVPIFDLHKKYLKFEHLDELFQFRVLPNGYCHGPRRFTKLLKPPLSILREEGVIIALYFDDFLNMHRNEDTCFQNTGKIVDLFQTLPFPKSSLSPSQTIEFLGFIINSGKMQVTLTSEKMSKLENLCVQMLQQNVVKIRQLASLLGKISSSFPASDFGRLHYSGLERLKTSALAYHKGNFNAKICLDEDAVLDISWWRDNVIFQKANILRPNPSLTITTDASKIGCGYTLVPRHQGELYSG